MTNTNYIVNVGFPESRAEVGYLMIASSAQEAIRKVKEAIYGIMPDIKLSSLTFSAEEFSVKKEQ